MIEDTLMFGGTMLIRTRPEMTEEAPWWLPGWRPEELTSPVAREDEEDEDEDEEDEDEDDLDEDDEDLEEDDEDEELDDFDEEEEEEEGEV